MGVLSLSKLAASMSQEEATHYGKGYLGPGVPERKRTEMPTVKEPQTWEFSAHPHQALRVGLHVDMRLGNPKTGIAHSFVLPKQSTMPGPGEMVRVIPTFDHEIPYMDYTGEITSTYGKGTVEKGRREKADVYHAEPDRGEGTKVRFNLYEGPQPEEFSIRKDRRDHWFLHNKTQTRESRPDIPASKPSYKEMDINDIDPTREDQAILPKLDGAHTIIDLKAGRAPRVFSYRVGKKSQTGLIEHTHKMTDLLKHKVPKELDGTVLRGETVGIKDGKTVPAESIAGLLNSKVWESRRKQEEGGVKLKAFPFSVSKYRGKDMEDAPFDQKLDILRKVQKYISDLEVPPVVFGAKEKIDLLNAIKSKNYPLTEEGVVLMDKDNPRPIKAKVIPDFDVYVQGVNPATKKGGGYHDRAGSISYSWTPDGPVVGQLGGFKHEEAKDMLKRPDKYIGRVAKVRAMKVFKKGDEMGALFQPRFNEWHLDKGDIEKSAFLDELDKIKQAYGEAEHKALMELASRGMSGGGNISPEVASLMLSGNIGTDVGIRHPWLPTNDAMHAFPTRSKRDILRRLAGQRAAAISNISKSIAAGGVLGGARSTQGLMNLGQAQHGFSDVYAHYDKPVELGIAGKGRMRKYLPKVPGAGSLGFVTSGAEHVRGGLTPKGFAAPSSGLDVFDPTKYKADLRAQGQAGLWGKAVRRDILKDLQRTHGLQPAQAEEALSKYFSSAGPGRASRVVGRTSRNLRFLGGQAKRPFSLVRRGLSLLRR